MAITAPQTSSQTVQPHLDPFTDAPYEGTADPGEFFNTLLDIINPLQHIPVISKIYREFTGDEITPAAQLIGGAVFGGPIGFASASANVLLEQASGEDLVGHAVALFSDDSSPNNSGSADQELLAQRPTELPGHTEAKSPEKFTTALAGDEIVWGGPRVIPSYSRPILNELKQSVTDNSNTQQKVQPPTTDAVSAVSEPVKPPATEKASLDWLPDALDVARASQSARTTGADTPPAVPQPWVANAMLEALNKYDALARARSEEKSDDPEPDTPS